LKKTLCSIYFILLIINISKAQFIDSLGLLNGPVLGVEDSINLKVRINLGGSINWISNSSYLDLNNQLILINYSLCPMSVSGGPVNYKDTVFKFAPLPANTFTVLVQIKVFSEYNSIPCSVNSYNSFAENSFTVSTDVGIKHFSGKENLFMSPNPFTDFVGFKNLKKPAYVTITDATGIKIKETVILPNDYLNTNQFKNGLYFFIMRYDGKQTVFKGIKK
jgi:hypothetical protein